MYSRYFVISILIWLPLQIMASTLELEVPLFETRTDFHKANNMADTYVFIEPAITYVLNDNISLDSQLSFAPLLAAKTSRFLGNHGLFIETLNLNLSYENSTLSIGKLNPTFGTMWDLGLGPWGRLGLPEDYELSEKLGTSNQLYFQTDRLLAILETSFYKADDSALSRFSIGEKRPDLAPSVSQTSGFDSGTISLTMQHTDLGTGFHAAIRKQRKGPMSSDESGYAIAYNGTSRLGTYIDLIPFLKSAFQALRPITLYSLYEYVSLDNINGEQGNTQYFSKVTSLSHENWNAALSSTQQYTGTSYSAQVQFSIGYQFSDSFFVDIGYQEALTDGVIDYTYGCRVSSPIPNISLLKEVGS